MDIWPDVVGGTPHIQLMDIWPDVVGGTPHISNPASRRVGGWAVQMHFIAHSGSEIQLSASD